MAALRSRKTVLAVAVVLVALLAIVAFIVFGMNGSLFDSQKIEVSSLQIATGGNPRPSISYSLTNLNSIDATSVGLSVDGSDCGQISLLIPSGKPCPRLQT
jgi:ABC-type Na+ efflux pump permease subunit